MNNTIKGLFLYGIGAYEKKAFIKKHLFKIY